MKRVLIVDDDAMIVDLLQSFLELEGLVIERAANGTEALTAMLESPPDVLLLDLMLPEMDGYALLDAMLSNDKLAAVPTIIISALAQPEAQIKAWKGSVCAYFTKPFNPNALAATVRQVLSGARPSEEERQAALARLKITTRNEG